jgi:folate-binding protein YgfZ
MSQHSTLIPAVSAAAYEAARRRAASLDRSARGRIVVSGADRASYLQGLLTNDIVALRPGAGCYAAYLTAQGRMIADLWVYEVGDVILLALEGDVKDTVLARLDQFIFSEDVQLGDVTATFAQIAIVGPDAAPVLAGVVPGVSVEALNAMREHDNIRVAFAGDPVIVVRILDAGEPGFELYAERARITAIAEAVAQAGVPALDEATADAIRIESGTPRFHRDMDETTIPLEAGIESRAISLTKGCYVGQEVIIRVLHRGHGRVARRLVGLRLDGADVPASGAVVRSAEREIGHVTSATRSPSLERPIALGYVHRDFVEPGTKVTVGEAAAEVAALPFVQGTPGAVRPGA